MNIIDSEGESGLTVVYGGNYGVGNGKLLTGIVKLTYVFPVEVRGSVNQGVS